MKDSYDVIIVGAGHNGLVCAAYLAKAGLDVLVVERRDLVGGACVTEELFPGYRFSACSYYCYLLQTKVIEDLQLRRHGFHVSPLDPLKCCLYPDGRALMTWDSVERTQDAIGRFSRHDAEAYPRWVAFWDRAAAVIHPYFLTPPPTLAEVAERLGTADDRAFLDRLLTASVEDVVTEFFENEAIRGAFIHAHDAGDATAPGSAWCFTYIRRSLLRTTIKSATRSRAFAHRSYFPWDSKNSLPPCCSFPPTSQCCSWGRNTAKRLASTTSRITAILR